MYAIFATAQYMRRARAFLRRHPHLRDRLEQTVDSLMADPWDPRLGLHRLHGKLRDAYAVRLTDSHRITLTILVAEEEVVLLDIGTHDEVYR